jgi:GNAT superfamily N-acetyltransferase
MSRVRPLCEEDLDQVVSLYQSVFRTPRGRTDSPPALRAYFERTLVRQPWADPDLPSLVYEGPDGRVLGFIGAHVRRLKLDGEPLRLVCAGQLVSDPAAQRRGVGAILLRALLKGPQDVTITDGGTPTVAEMWGRLTGEVGASLRSVAWIRPFRPACALGDRFFRQIGHEDWYPAVLPVLGAFDRLVKRRLEPDAPAGVDAGEELTPGALLSHLPAVTEGLQLHVDYDRPYLEWLFDEMEQVRSRGPLARRLVRRGDAVIGWYVAYLPPNGLGQTLQVAALPGAVDAVVERLFFDAAEAGVAALAGRLEPALFEPLLKRHCVLRQVARALVHSSDPAVRCAVERGRALLTRMDGEWWMGYPLEDATFGGAASVPAGAGPASG